MTQKLSLRALKFAAGAYEGGESLEVETPSVTLLVGPNNSGKSLALRELESWCQGEQPLFVVLEDVTLDLPDSAAEIRAMLHPFESSPPDGQHAQAGHTWYTRPAIRTGEPDFRIHVSDSSWSQWFEARARPDVDRVLRGNFVRPFVLRLDGRTRFDLMDDKPTGQLEKKPANSHWALFVDPVRREQVRRFTEEAFGRHFVIDPTGMTVYRARLSDRKPIDEAEEQALDARARAFHSAAPLISALGDGVKASIGLVAAVMSLPHRILLIDEPEAFLHPTLARRMGRTLATAARERQASIVIATHSADLLWGCIQAAPDLRLIRLTYEGGASTARSIDIGAVTTLVNDPLLRSSNALSAIFHRGVVVTEADADRAFYEEVNSRLLQAGRGIEDALFLNAQNWQTVIRIARPLRSLGIPAAAILDFDVLASDEFLPVWDLVSAKGRPLQTLQDERAAIKVIITAIPKADRKLQGVLALDANDQERVYRFLKAMRRHGVFFVPIGELESWLGHLQVPRKDKGRWITTMFTRLGADPDSNEYVRPSTTDVWSFMSDVGKWIAQPGRI